jgi:hypothetical protein
MSSTKGIVCGHELTAKKKLKVLVLYEFSGIVRDEFRKRGHHAVSLDLLPSESGQEHHIKCNVRRSGLLWESWDLLIAFPPCTYLTSAGNRWLKEPGRLAERERERSKMLNGCGNYQSNVKQLKTQSGIFRARL